MNEQRTGPQLHRRVRVDVTCRQCGKVTSVTNSRIKEGGGKFCSVACADMQRGKSGASNPNFTGKPFVSSRGYVHLPATEATTLEHRAIMERVLDRPLLPSEVVHHINEVKSDNRPENLQVVTHAEHRQIHKPHEGGGQCARCARYVRKGRGGVKNELCYTCRNPNEGRAFKPKNPGN